MFRCQQCDTVVPAGTRSNKIVTQTRSKVYESRGPDPSERRGRYPRGRGRPKKKEYDRGGTGTEIVREIMVCPKCAEELNAEIERERQAALAAAEAAEAAAEPVAATE